MTSTPTPAALADAVEVIDDVHLRRFPKYDDVVETAIEGLGQLPRHWQLKPLKRVVRINPEDLPDSTDDDYRFTYVDIGNVDYVQGIVESESYKFANAPSRARRRVADGDTIISTVRTYLKAVAKIEGPTEDLIVSTGFAVLRPGHEVDPGFLYRCVQSDVFVNRVVAFSTGVSYPAIAPTTLGRFPIWFPPIDEQQAIAQFLDRETAKIDSLVAKKRRLVERLKEKRTTLISHAVTKGLNPDAPTKPSGFDWIGEVPEHWGLRRVKYIAKVGNGSTPERDNPEYWGGEYPWLNSSVVNGDKAEAASDFVTDLALRECHLPRIEPPAVLIGITGEGKTRGMSTVLSIEATINQHMAYVSPKPGKCDAYYLHRVFESAYAILRSDSDGGGSTKGAITCQQIANLAVPFPPISEQEAIAASTSDSIGTLDSLSRDVEAAIARLNEYRTALISAAVTGKIDVRREAT